MANEIEVPEVLTECDIKGDQLAGYLILRGATSYLWREFESEAYSILADARKSIVTDMDTDTMLIAHRIFTASRLEKYY
jgi:hypothetical protein